MQQTIDSYHATKCANLAPNIDSVEDSGQGADVQTVMGEVITDVQPEKSDHRNTDRLKLERGEVRENINDKWKVVEYLFNMELCTTLNEGLSIVIGQDCQ